MIFALEKVPCDWLATSKTPGSHAQCFEEFSSLTTGERAQAEACSCMHFGAIGSQEGERLAHKRGDAPKTHKVQTSRWNSTKAWRRLSERAVQVSRFRTGFGGQASTILALVWLQNDLKNGEIREPVKADAARHADQQA